MLKDFNEYFQWPDVHIEHFYAYLILAILIAGYLVYKSKSRYKLEIFFISFFLISGNINQILTFKIPGVTLFEIQPIRFIFILLAFLIVRKTLFSAKKITPPNIRTLPLFEIALYAYVVLLILSVVVNASDIGIDVVMRNSIDAVAFIGIFTAIRMIADKPSYYVIGNSIIIGAIISSIVSLIQFSIDPYFLRIGDDRLAFGDVIRSNGIFDNEYFNSYYLIIAISWVLITLKKDYLKILLVGLFTLGVISSFQRMSWIILAVVFFIYLAFIRKLAVEKLVVYGLSGLALVLSISIFYYQDIMRSSLVQDRLMDTIEGRAGYYNLVLENIDEKPIFGFGDLQNENYYTHMLRITGSRERASAEAGDLHSGYFSVLYLYGIPAVVSFLLFVILAVIYFTRQYKIDLFFAIPLLVSVIYMISNLTNTFLFLKYLAILYSIHIGIALGMKELKESKV